MIQMFQQGGVTIYFLLLASLATITVCLERIIRLRRAGTDTLPRRKATGRRLLYSRRRPFPCFSMTRTAARAIRLRLPLPT